MSFATWCAVQSMRIRADLNALYYAMLRRRFARERRAARARLWEIVERG
jgi:hypothetical protein